MIIARHSLSLIVPTPKYGAVPLLQCLLARWLAGEAKVWLLHAKNAWPVTVVLSLGFISGDRVAPRLVTVLLQAYRVARQQSCQVDRGTEEAYEEARWLRRWPGSRLQLEVPRFTGE